MAVKGENRITLSTIEKLVVILTFAIGIFSACAGWAIHSDSNQVDTLNKLGTLDRRVDQIDKLGTDYDRKVRDPWLREALDRIDRNVLRIGLRTHTDGLENPPASHP